VEPSSSRARVLTLLATAAAAATAAFVASRLGVGGTIVGAALISVIASIGAEIYTTAAHRTTERVADLARAKRSTNEVPEVPLTSMVDPESTVPAPDDDDVADDGGRASSGPQDEDPAVSGPERVGPPLRFSWVHVAGVAGIVFLAVVGGITALELIAGRPLSSWWTDDSSTGTTIGQVVAAPGATPSPAAPTGTAAPTPAASPTALPTELPTTAPPPETAAPTPPATASAVPTTTATPAGTTGATP
jgi:hypothetical protein